jgi:hypothetical protein
LSLKDTLKEEIDEKIEKLSAILESDHSQKDLKHAEELRKEINYKKALLKTI